MNAYSMMLGGAEGGEQEILRKRRLQYLKPLHCNLPMADFDTKNKILFFFLDVHERYILKV